MPDPERSRALVLEFWHAPFDDRARFFTDDIVWHLPPSVRQSGLERDVRGDAAAALFEMGYEVYESGMTWDIEHVLVDGDLVALHCTFRGRTATGNRYEGPYHMLFRLDDDRIAEAWEFLDTAYALERIGPRFPGGDEA